MKTKFKQDTRTTGKPKEKDTGSEKYVFKLYVAGASRKSTRAINNIRALGDKHFKGSYELEIIDIYQNPIIAKNGQIIAVPTLVKELPGPVKKFVGDLTKTQKLLLGLNIEKKE